MEFEFEFSCPCYPYCGQRVWVKRSIEEITDTGGKTLIFTVASADLERCIYFGWKHYKNFLDEVKYYRFCCREEASPRQPVTVKFYR